MCLWEFLRVTIRTCVFCADGIMITNNSNNYYVFLNVFMFRIMSMTLRNINPQKEIFHHYDFPVYTTSKYRDPKLDTYRRITHKFWHACSKTHYWKWFLFCFQFPNKHIITKCTLSFLLLLLRKYFSTSLVGQSEKELVCAMQKDGTF